MKLSEVALEIRNLIYKKQQELNLTFEEERHIYSISGNTNYPSVSSVLKKFYREFPTEEAAYNKAKGDLIKQQELIEEWAAAGTYSTNMGSRVHYLLEKKTIEKNGEYKEVRKPIFECDITQLTKGDAMVSAGVKYLELMEKRGVRLIDTEIVLGDPELGYVGQPDKVWLTVNKSGDDFGLLITDWKSNKPKNFIETDWTERMFEPFEKYPNNALGHYYLQLPLYARLLIKMLKGTKYENIKLLGCIIVLLKEDGTYEEFRVPKEIIDTVFSLDIKSYLN